MGGMQNNYLSTAGLSLVLYYNRLARVRGVNDKLTCGSLY